MPETTHDFAIIKANFEKWTNAWNANDIEGYLACYLPSDETRWISGGQMLQGVDAIASAYRTRFQTGTGMGQLSLNELRPDIMTATDALIFGAWSLQNDNGQYQGVFTAHLKKVDGDWLIITDHATALDDSD